MYVFMYVCIVPWRHLYALCMLHFVIICTCDILSVYTVCLSPLLLLVSYYLAYTYMIYACVGPSFLRGKV